MTVRHVRFPVEFCTHSPHPCPHPKKSAVAAINVVASTPTVHAVLEQCRADFFSVCPWRCGNPVCIVCICFRWIVFFQDLVAIVEAMIWGGGSRAHTGCTTRLQGVAMEGMSPHFIQQCHSSHPLLCHAALCGFGSRGTSEHKTVCRLVSGIPPLPIANDHPVS